DTLQSIVQHGERGTHRAGDVGVEGLNVLVEEGLGLPAAGDDVLCERPGSAVVSENREGIAGTAELYRAGMVSAAVKLDAAWDGKDAIGVVDLQLIATALALVDNLVNAGQLHLSFGAVVFDIEHGRSRAIDCQTNDLLLSCGTCDLQSVVCQQNIGRQTRN